MMPNYHFKGLLGPTEINLMQAFKRQSWWQSDVNPLFNNDNLLGKEVLKCFEYKHLLHRWLMQHQLDFAPKTWVVDELTLHKTLKKMRLDRALPPWIIKPSTLNNGQGITVVDSIEAIDAYFKTSKRFSGIHVIQQYIEKPKLWEKRKFSIRVFVVLHAQEMYLHSQGYANVCYELYCPHEITKLNAHLTNEHLFKAGKKNNQQILSRDWDEFPLFFPTIKEQCEKLFLPFYKSDKVAKGSFSILGVDFMMDSENKLWLLEVNDGPCFPIDDSHPLFDSLYVPFWDKVVEVIAASLKPDNLHS